MITLPFLAVIIHEKTKFYNTFTKIFYLALNNKYFMKAIDFTRRIWYNGV